MINDTPYIIVDNQKIPPIGRSPGPDSTTQGRTTREEESFDVVDRVTISPEAREKARRYQIHAEADPAACDNLSITLRS